MTPAAMYSVITFLLGLVLLFGWLYATAENPRFATLLLKSVFLFVLPGSALALIPVRLLQFPLSMWLAVFIEEGLKAAAAATEDDPADRFWLVILFGIWELTLGKPAWGVTHSALLQSWQVLQIAGLAAGGLVAVVMHGVTAEIYGFRFSQRLPIAFVVCWAIHTAFNEIADVLEVSLFLSLLQILILLPIFVALWPWNASPLSRRGN
jgi:hypothetical protein